MPHPHRADLPDQPCRAYELAQELEDADILLLIRTWSLTKGAGDDQFPRDDLTGKPSIQEKLADIDRTVDEVIDDLIEDNFLIPPAPGRLEKTSRGNRISHDFRAVKAKKKMDHANLPIDTESLDYIQTLRTEMRDLCDEIE